MTSNQRATLVTFLTSATLLRRDLGLDVLVEKLDGTPGVFVRWDPRYEAYAATWGCGRIAADDIARLAG